MSPFFGFVIGNGQSRKNIDLEALRNYDRPIFGCNALYRDFEPDMLILGDKPILEEAKAAGVRNYVGVRRGTGACLLKDGTPLLTLPTFPDNRDFNWYSGVAAVWYLKHSYPNIDTVFLLGFDFEGRVDGEINNLYIGTSCYPVGDTMNSDTHISSLGSVFGLFPETTFLRVGNDDLGKRMPSWDNVEFITTNKMKRQLAKAGGDG